ncbi:MAG: hypothetical protein L6R41_006198 [Letrouitia leprolyta]|nr:MAG: hypothetical protein L6R41_006198 [Letrouitia leprolyta]
MASLQNLNSTVLVSLLGFSLLSFWGTWGIGYRTGFLALIKDTLNAPKQLLPVVAQPVHHTYTAIPPVDALIRRLNVFLWPAIDGTWPGLCLVAWEFSGMFSASWIVTGIEGLRTTIIGTLSQTITYGTILPLYLFLHVLTSPTNLGPSLPSPSDLTQDFLIEPAELAAWAPSFALSYLLPTFLVILPSPQYTSWTVHQYIMAWWELYPVPFKIFQILLAKYVFKKIYTSSSSTTTTSESKKKSATMSQPSSKKAQTLQLLRYTYLAAALISAFTHIITLTLSYSTYFFPSIFSAPSPPSTLKSLYLSPFSLSPYSVFVPPSPFHSTPINNLGEGLYHFLLWNMQVSNFAPLVWGLLQYRNACAKKGEEWEGWGVVVGKVAAVSAVAGQGASVAWLAWKREEVVFA